MNRLDAVIGLGNPGSKYDNTYHNVGFAAVDCLCSAYRARLVSDKNGWFYSLKQAPVDFAGQPGRYVNRSGEVLHGWTRRFGLKKENVLVIYDDLALKVGKIRIRPAGSSGGHNGVQNIIDCLQTDQFPRIRIGIGPCPNKVAGRDYVLSKVSSSHSEIFEKIIARIPKIVTTISEEGTQLAMNEWNGVDFSG